MSGAGKLLISTLIPTYSRSALLQRAITSAVDQYGVDVRVCVFDNCSEDDTSEIVSRMAQRDARIQYQRHPHNIGGFANFDFAMRGVATPFFSILSDDDYLLPGFYQRALADLIQNPQAMFWVGETLWVDERGSIWDARVGRWPREGVYLPPEGVMGMMHGQAPTWTGVVFRRELLDRIGYLDAETLGPSDLDFMLRAATQPFVLRKSPVAVYMLNTTSYSATQPLSSFWPGWQRMFGKVENNPAFDEPTRVAVLAALHQDAQRMLFRRGANALASKRYDFSQGAAQALYSYYGKRWHAGALRILSWLCEAMPWAQHVYTKAYRGWERHLVKSRITLEARYGHLVQRQRRGGASALDQR